MHVETKDVLKRYNITIGTLNNKRSIIVANGGVILGKTRHEGNIYKTSVLDRLARNGDLGKKPKIAMLNKDAEKETL